MSTGSVRAPTLAPPRVGIDLVRISRIADSVSRFGDRFLRRIFTPDEVAYARAAPALTAERLAARFAAKEAARKALQLTDGIDWRLIEVCRRPSGDCDLVLHDVAAQRTRGTSAALSMSHEGDYATAVVLAFPNPNQDQP
jgi:holo-[acyl-carrier protein] synthase